MARLRLFEKILQNPWDYVEKEAKDRGSYLLILHLKKKKKINVGCLGNLVFKPGFYIYVGSAMAHLSKRLERHRRLRKHHHWHIDELRAYAHLQAALAIQSSERLECEIADALAKIAEWNIPGFGSSDCFCKSHLFAMLSDPLKTPSFQKLLLYFRMNKGLQNSMDRSGNAEENVDEFNLRKER